MRKTQDPVLYHAAHHERAGRRQVSGYLRQHAQAGLRHRRRRVHRHTGANQGRLCARGETEGEDRRVGRVRRGGERPGEDDRGSRVSESLRHVVAVVGDERARRGEG